MLSGYPFPQRIFLTVFRSPFLGAVPVERKAHYITVCSVRWADLFLTELYDWQILDMIYVGSKSRLTHTTCHSVWPRIISPRHRGYCFTRRHPIYFETESPPPNGSIPSGPPYLGPGPISNTLWELSNPDPSIGKFVVVSWAGLRNRQPPL